MNFRRFFVLLILILPTYGCRQHSGFCHYVSVEAEKNFTGEWLRHSSAIEQKILTVQECASNDAAYDDGNNKQGNIRWVECYAGPDCDEAGMY